MDVANVTKIVGSNSSQPQCQFFVVRKKRLCRMTVRPGRDYCGEHEPQPTEKDKDDRRIPCPYDPKHTCYASKLLKHLAICNARQSDFPDYIVHNINAPLPTVPDPIRMQLSQVPEEKISALIDKVNNLYEKYVKDTITVVTDQPIHSAVMADFAEEGRTESSLRHLRQVSSLMNIVETENLVQDGTCYVELGAGKGVLSYYAHSAWCAGGASGVVLVDRAALRHKRDNRLRGAARRLRADLAHLALDRVPEVAASAAVVGVGKHLCGAATDYAVRCVTGAGVARRVRGLVLATCCHHRCEPAAYVAGKQLQEMGITAEELNIMLGAVSWATCGDGRSRERAAGPAEAGEGAGREERARAGRRAKALLDHGRVRYLQERGLRARLCRYVPPAVSPENVAIVATRD